MSRLLLLLSAALLGLGARARLAGECAMMCNDLRSEVLTMEMCSEAKRTLPRPKVGDFCSNAMEQGFSDACVSLCMEQRPVLRVAQTCRAAAVEMPRPTVRKWCEHGYNVAFEKTREDLAAHFKADRQRFDEQAAAEAEAQQQQQQQQPAEEAAAVGEEQVQEPAVVVVAEAVEAAAVATEATEATQATDQTVLARIPVTIGGKDLDLLLHEGESAEDAVVAFCRENVKEDVSACIRQMLPEVLERMESEGGAVGGLRGSGST